MRPALRLLIVGGYGTFGGRLVELLINEPRLEIVVAGRSASQGAAFCSARQDAVARLVPARFDRNADVLEQLRTLAPEILVDASGPFQAYGEGRYRLIEACIAQGIHYLDLADGSDFVAGVRAFDAAARAAGVYVLSGVSSFPVLTAAVVRHLSSDMTRVASILGGIAPSPYAGVGQNVIRAILVLRRWSIFGIPLPSWLAPRSNSYETEQDGRFRFHVEISHPWTGLIVRYRGWLVATAVD